MSDEPSTAQIGRSRKRLVWAGAGAVLVAAATVTVLLATGSDDSDADCWGAWGGLESPWAGGEVEVSEARPSAADPRGSCEVVVTLESEDGEDGEDEPWQHRLEVSYGPLPTGRDELDTWFLEQVRGDAAPLPGGLAGGVSTEHGMLVLPAECAIDGEPAVVTMRTHFNERWGDRGDVGNAARPADSPSHMAELLLGVARQGMAGAGCAADEDGERADDEAGITALPEVVPPVQRLPSTRSGEQHLCGNPELPQRGRDNEAFSGDVLGHFHAWTATVGAEESVCSHGERRWRFSADTGRDRVFGPATRGNVLLTTAHPDLIRLLTALTDSLAAAPIDGWDGTAVRAGRLAVATLECGTGEEGPTPTLFAAYTFSESADLLTDYVRLTAPARDCEGVAPDA